MPDNTETAEITEAADTSPAPEERRASRRTFLVGGAIGGAAAVAAGVALLAEREAKPRLTTNVLAQRVRHVPAEDPESSAWAKAPTAHVELEGQMTTVPSKSTPSVPWVDVQALYDPETIAFRIRWPDATRNDLAIECEQFRDACAVLLAPDVMNPALRLMGTAEVPVALMHWKADWQRDVDRGRQDPKVAYPNATFDYYPPLAAGSGDNVTIADYVEAKATEWLPGLYVGNPLSAAKRTTPIEKLSARGFGTATTAATQNARGRGVRNDGGWSVVLAKPRRPADKEEFMLRAGKDYGMAVAVWAGNQQDRGSRKSPSKNYLQLVLE